MSQPPDASGVPEASSGARQPLSFGLSVSAAAAKKRIGGLLGKSSGVPGSSANVPPKPRVLLADAEDPALLPDPDAPQRIVLGEAGATAADLARLQRGGRPAEPELVIPLIEKNRWRGVPPGSDEVSAGSGESAEGGGSENGQETEDSQLRRGGRRIKPAEGEDLATSGASELEQEAVRRLLAGQGSAGSDELGCVLVIKLNTHEGFPTKNLRIIHRSDPSCIRVCVCVMVHFSLH